MQVCCSKVMEACCRGRWPLAARWRAGSQVDGGWRPGSPLDGGRRSGSQVAGRRVETRVAHGRRAQVRVAAGGDQGHPWTAGVGQGRPWPAGRFGPGLLVDGGRMTGSHPDGGLRSGSRFDPLPSRTHISTTTPPTAPIIRGPHIQTPRISPPERQRVLKI